MYRQILSACATALLLAPVVGCSTARATPTPAAARTGASPVPGPTATASPSQEAALNPDTLLASALTKVLPDPAGEVSLSVAVTGLDTQGAQDSRTDQDTQGAGVEGQATAPVAVYRGGTAFDTASIVKADILAALLLQAQGSDRALSSQERSWATAMIESSDNDAATALWAVIGGAAGLDAANERLGLTGTTGGTDGDWGLTRTTAADQVTLLRTVFTAEAGPGAGAGARTGSGTGAKAADPVLDAASRAYVRELMGRVVPGQDWGVSAAGTATALKNGWMPRTATGLWVINTIGTVTADGRRWLLAVLSSGNADKEAGVALVEAAARAAVTAAAAF